MRYLFTLACLLLVTATVADEPELNFSSVGAKKARRDYKKAVAKDEKIFELKQKKLNAEIARAAKENRDAFIENLEKALKKSMQTGNLDEANKISAAIKTIRGATASRRDTTAPQETLPPEPRSENKKPVEVNKNIQGRWRIIGTNGQTSFYLILSGDGSATKSHAPDIGGRWNHERNRVIVKWDDGWNDVIVVNGTKGRKYGFSPSSNKSGRPTNMEGAEKVSP